MTKLSKHSTSKEWACKCGCGTCKPSQRALDLFEFIRAFLNRLNPVFKIRGCFTSGCRCEEHNNRKAVDGGAGGSPRSEHITSDEQEGNAFDVYFYFIVARRRMRIDATEALIFLFKCGVIKGLIIYDNFRYHIGSQRRYRTFKDLRAK